MINIHGLLEEDGIPLGDEQFKELMKFDNDEIDISTVTFRLETAERIGKMLDLENLQLIESPEGN